MTVGDTVLVPPVLVSVEARHDLVQFAIFVADQVSVGDCPLVIDVLLVVSESVDVLIFTVCGATLTPALFTHVSVYDLLLVSAGVVKD